MTPGRELLIIVPLLGLTLFAYVRREQLFGLDAAPAAAAASASSPPSGTAAGTTR